MSKKGFDFRLEIEGVKDDDKFSKNTELLKEIKELFKITPFPLDGAGFDNDGEFLIVSGQVCRVTKKEAEAEYTIFKERLLRILKKYYKKIKGIDRMKLYFTTLN